MKSLLLLFALVSTLLPISLAHNNEKPAVYSIESYANPAKCVQAKSLAAGANAEIFDCKDTPNQKFLFFEKVTTHIRVNGTHWCLSGDKASKKVTVEKCKRHHRKDNDDDDFEWTHHHKQAWRYCPERFLWEHSSGNFLTLPKGDTGNGKALEIDPLADPIPNFQKWIIEAK